MKKTLLIKISSVSQQLKSRPLKCDQAVRIFCKLAYVMGAKNGRESGEIYGKSLPFLSLSTSATVQADHYTFLRNCPPTPPLSQH